MAEHDNPGEGREPVTHSLSGRVKIDLAKLAAADPADPDQEQEEDE